MLLTFQRNQRARSLYEKRGFVAVEFTDGSRDMERTPTCVLEPDGVVP